jgi:hypothetical protein
MIKQIILPNPKHQNVQELYKQELVRLQEPGALRRQLTDIDESKPFRRVYVMGCGRSGTWVLTHVMSTFDDTDVLRQELPVEYFGLFTTDRSVLIFKRDHLAYRRIRQIPESIEIAYIVRHPFDVLTSHLPTSQRPYHVLPERWLGEIGALQHLVVTGRKYTKIIRYEDLVTRPIEAQSDLAGFFGLPVGQSIGELYTVSNNPTEAAAHRARKLDTYSIDKYKRDPKKLKYLEEIRPRLGEMLEWVGKEYNYDLSL